MGDRERPLKILLVDDNKADAALVRELFEDIGYPGSSLDWASSSEEALKLVSSYQYDLVLLDYHLDLRSGLDLVHEAAQKGCKFPFILLTGQDQHNVDIAAMEAGAADYLVKDQLTAPLLERAVRYAIERSRAGQALRESEARFRALIENSAEGIFLSGSDGTITYASPSITRILGYDAAEIVGRRVEQIIHPDDSVKVRQIFDQLQQHPGVPLTSTYRFLKKDGDWRWIESVATNFLQDAAVGAIVHNYRDVTERVHSEDQLRQSELRYRTLFETNPQPTWVYDRETLAFLAVNQAACEHYGYTREEFLAMTLRDIRPAEDIPKLLYHLQSQGREKRSAELWRHHKKDGSLIYVEIASEPLSFDGLDAHLVVSKDVTQRMLAEEALRESEERYRSLVRASSEIVWTAKSDGSEMVSPDWAEFTGRPETKISGYEWYQLVHPEDRALIAKQWKNSSSTKAILSAEYRVLKPDGTYAHVATRGVPLLNENGEIRKWVGMTNNITARKIAEEERDRFFTLSLDLFCIADANGYLKRLNPAFEAALGYTQQELIEQSLLNFVHPDDLAQTRLELEKVRTGGASRGFVNRYRCRDGSYKWLSWVSTYYGGLSYAAARDITDLKAAEAQVEKSLSLLEATLEATADGILVIDEQGKISDYNGKFVRMWGIPEEMLASNQEQQILSHAQSQLMEPESLLELVQGDKEYALLHLKDGRIVELYSQSQILGEEKLGRVWSFRDVSERNRSETVQFQLNSQLQQERQRLDDVLTNVPGIVWEQYFGRRGRVDYVSNYVQTMLGYSPREWLSAPQAWKKVLHPDDRSETIRNFEGILRSGQGRTLQYRMFAADGRMVWVESHCAPLWDEKKQVIGMRGVSMDITERMLAQEEQARLAALLENTTDFVGWADTKGRPQYINCAGRVLLGLGQDEDISKLEIATVCPPWALDLVQKFGLPTALEKGVWSGQTALLTRQGEEIPISQVIIAHKNERGEPIFFSTIGRDVRRQKKVEAALQKANDELELRVIERTAELEQANRDLMKAKEEADGANAAKSEFLSRMSHELRTPLNAILGFGQILEMRDLGPKETEGVSQILKAGRHLLALINEVLDIARIEAKRLSLSPEPIDVAHALRESLDLVRPLAAARQIELINLLESGEASHQDWHIRGDRQRVYQILLNLLSNAIKYNREGGRVTLSARLADANEEEAIHYLRIEVRDTGLGLTEAEQKRLFTPFERLGAERAKVEGTGIGLALTKMLVEAMGGRIGVQSQADEGSTFWIEMPLVEGTLKQLQRLQPEQDPISVVGAIRSSIRPSTLLYIEDNVANLKVIERILVDLPQVKILAAMQGGIGLDFAQQNRPDLIVLDVHLPDMSGHEVLLTLQKSPHTRHIPVVIISADGTQRQINRLLAAGAKDYLTKPLNVKQFFGIVEEYLGDGH